MKRVNELLSAGIPLPAAIKQALREKGLSQTTFSARYRIPKSTANEVLTLARTPRAEVMRALAEEFGGSPYAWARLFWENSEPTANQFAAVD